MLQTLSNRFRQPIAATLSLFFCLQLLTPLYSYSRDAASSVFWKSIGRVSGAHSFFMASHFMAGNRVSIKSGVRMSLSPDTANGPSHIITDPLMLGAIRNKRQSLNSIRDIGGPASPEASSFKAAGSDNLVNLFTGDFSYSIPLLDVDGYPVNLFYNGGITMEQEASWVGLGWNINPGSVSRNMRGVPDDFDGTDSLVQTQNVKPNKTWGGEIGADGELLGIKAPNLNFNIGFSYNNYLGPELDIGAGVSVSIPITKTIVHEKSAPNDSSQGLNLSLGLGAKLSSRSGLTLSPSLNAGLHSVSQKMDLGVGISTGYNSRTGIQNLNIHSQMSAYQSVQSNIIYLPSRVGLGTDISNTTISFARPSYMPTLRMPMQNSYASGQLEIGIGMFGARGAGTLQGYYTESHIASTTLYKPLVGYMYLEKANGRKDAVMDFNRLNDGEVTPHTPLISAPQYDYDIFTVQGEGTGGSIRAYRSDLGFMRDNETNSKDKNISVGFDIAPVGHFGGNLNSISAPTRSGNWDDANNTLNQTLAFSANQSNTIAPNISFKNVYFRNPGEATVTNDNMISTIGQDNLVRFKIDGSAVTPRLESQLEQFSKKTGATLGTIPLLTPNTHSASVLDKRTQVITMLRADDASKIGLETSIRNYQSTLDINNNLQYVSIPRVGGYRKNHHISQVTVLEATGMRYVYGLPVYNKVQRDFTFSVAGVPADAAVNLVNYTSDEPTTGSGDINGNTGIDGYINEQQTPAYASSFLITGVLSPDYVDVTGDGITEDDLGSAVKFDYSMSDSLHRWRTPRTNTTNSTTPAIAHFNAGLRTEKRDNKATISYGEREAWYLHSIESKSMIAIFSTSPRLDAKGVKSDMDGSANSLENANRKLDSISLYTKADIKANGLAGAIPLKTVHFDYKYVLCPNTPDNPIVDSGKLTLVDIYFTFNGQSRASKDQYVFDYGNLGSKKDNAGYAYNASDRWGTYKPVKDSAGNAVNPNGLNNIDYPYTSSTNKPADDQFAAEWALKRILLPSGGQMEMTYEADDYAYVQNRRACNLLNIYGLGNSTDFSRSNMLYTAGGNQDQNYVYIQLPTPLQNTDPVKIKQEILAKYLDGINQLAFKLNINMPKGMEPLTAYSSFTDYGLCTNSSDRTVIYVKLSTIDGKGPLANASVHFLIDDLPGQAFPGYDLSNDPTIPAFLDLIASELSGFANAFKNAESQMRSSGFGSSISLVNSFVRLDNPTFFKYGGGYRVKRVLVKDNWNAMSSQYTSQYGQDYDYTTSQIVNGVPTTISSGVASYEPGIGSEENPFREILQFEDKLPLASAQYGAIEMPALEGLFPAPVVGYSMVTVRSINRNGSQGTSVVRSAIGKQVTEFYTARNYPTYYTYTPMATIDYHHNPAFTFFYKETIDKRTVSQGFLVETNDMHGKMKRQSAYSESDGNTPLSYTLHTYKNTGSNGLNDKVDFVHNDQSGAVISGNMGIDMELMTDAREFSVISNGTDLQAQVDFFTFVPWPIFGIFAYALDSYTENRYRAVTTTKLINYHAIEDSVIVNDKGSTVSTKTIAYDAETGSPVVTRTANEFNDPIYNISYPAYWAYSGVAPAYKNIGMQFSGVSFSAGRIVAGVADQSVFESGDELYITSPENPAATCPTTSVNVAKVWALDVLKDTTALTIPAANRSLIFIDSAGNPFTQTNQSFTIVRSGKRNDLSQTIGNVTAMVNPIQTVGSTRQLVVTSADNVVAGTAVQLREKWMIDPDIVQYFSSIVDPSTCARVLIQDCNGTIRQTINPYCKGLLGHFKPYRAYTYYGSRLESNPAVNTTIRKNGYINGYTNFWNFNSFNNLMPAFTYTRNQQNGNIVYNYYNWVWNTALDAINSKGQELETKNALNIYTSAQYGFAKNLPVAMVQNARYGQSFYEGFEDYNYSETLNKATQNTCDNTKYISFNGLGNGSIALMDTSATKAHTGKYGLKISPSSAVTRSLPYYTPFYTPNNMPNSAQFIADLNNYDPDYFIFLNNVTTTTSTMINPGFLATEANGSSFYFSTNNNTTTTDAFSGENTGDQDSWYNFTNDVLSFEVTHIGTQTPVNRNSPVFTGYTIPIIQYFTIPQSGTYTLDVGVSTSNPNPGGPSLNGGNSVIITEMATGRVYSPLSSTSITSAGDPAPTGNTVVSAQRYQFCLPQGAYSLATTCVRSVTIGTCGTCTGVSNWGAADHYWAEFRFLPTGTIITGYSNPNGTPITCTQTAPVTATDSMLNARFALVKGNKMQFSAWVKEDCGNAPGTACTLTSYVNDHVSISFPGSTILPSVTFRPSGTIIDGWQKVEGVFTVPSDGTTNPNLILSNDGGSANVYFDDIRIHPFNADMKSYVYDPRTLRLSAELDENNYGTFYNYDEEGQLVRVKKETIQGIKTIKEVRTAKQKLIKALQ